MPQIANQDYNVIIPEVAKQITSDAPALSKLAYALERGTIFDCVFRTYDTSETQTFMCRPISVGDVEGDRVILYAIFRNGGFALETVTITGTGLQYSALAEIQRQTNDAFPLVSLGENDYIYDDISGMQICTLEGNHIVGELDDDDRFVSFRDSGVKAEGEYGTDYIMLSMEDINNLIGWPCI